MKKYFTKSLAANPETLFFQGHSHHLWPDSGILGQQQATHDAMTLADHKWEKVFGKLIPQARVQIAKMINYPDPSNMVFGSNTHEFIARLFTSFHHEGKRRVLASTSEFHSFKRQMMRFEELGFFEVCWVDVSAGEENKILQDVCEAAEKYQPDVIFLSQCFFDSGYFLSEKCLEKLVQRTAPETEIVVDIYHSFATRELNYSFAENIHLLGGCYKYAQAGEGLCFFIPSKNYLPDPIITGWFASFKSLEIGSGKVDFDPGADRFWGATTDPSGLYRFLSVWDNYQKEGMTLNHFHQHVVSCQKLFLEKFSHSRLQTMGKILVSDIELHGHFLALKLKDESEAKKLHQELMNLKIETDYRGDRVRFGFGIYIDQHDVEELFARLQK